MEIDQVKVAIIAIMVMEVSMLIMSYFSQTPVDKSIIVMGIVAIAGLAGFDMGMTTIKALAGHDMKKE